MKPDGHEVEEREEEKAPGLEMDDFLISEEEPESLDQYLERTNSVKTPQFDSRELI